MDVPVSLFMYKKSKAIVLLKNAVAVFILLFLIGQKSYGQVEMDTLAPGPIIIPDEIVEKIDGPRERVIDPNKALLMALVLPGAGQVYNEKVWKLPLLYSGVITTVYFLEFNNRRYKRFLVALDIVRDPSDNRPNPFPNLNQDGIIRNVNFWRRNRDAMYMVFGAIYALSIVDAFVDAHLANFDVSDDLSFRIEPSVEPIMASNASLGISFKLKF